MLFNSWSFVIFFPVVTALYFLFPHRFRWVLLLVASAVFYMAFVPYYILILFFAIGVDYVTGLLIARSEGFPRRAWLIVSVTSSLTLLCVFKYWGFLCDNVRFLTGILGLSWAPPALRLVLPIGLSFHIFQSLAYVIEVYRGKQPAERHLGIFALYVMFYPQLVAGPIERPQNLLHQFRTAHSFSAERLVRGLERMLWGLFKKVVVADRLAGVVSRVYDDPHHFTGIPLAFATVCFSIQIYCDFSGYSDIALGSAEVMGIRLMENFRQPYQAQSIAEFWQRWHISLSTWFRDYVYIPLGGNRVGRLNRYRNVMIVFVLSGLWHGASWNFAIWGALHGLFMVGGDVTRKARTWVAERLAMGAVPWAWNALRVGTVFVLVSYAWIFFRARSFDDAWYVATHVFRGVGPQTVSARAAFDALLSVTSKLELRVAFLAVAILLSVDALRSRGSVRDWLHRRPLWARWAVYYCALLSIVLLGAHEKLAFIYFQF